MKKQIVILGIIVILIFVGFSGCFGNENKSEEDKFVGTWNHGTLPTGRPLIFKSNGNCNFLGEQAMWEVKDEKLVVNYTNFENEIIFDYEFLDDNKVLILTETISGQVDDYKKQ